MNHSLVFFTVFCQTAAGALILSAVTNLTINFSEKRNSPSKSIFLIPVFFFLSLSIAFFHLGNPLNAVNALNNLAKSWLSREILFLSLSGTMAILYCAALVLNWRSLFINILGILSATFSFMLIYSMIRLYMLPSVASWFNIFTPTGFAITSLTGGLGLILITYNHDEKKSGLCHIFLTVLVVAGIINSLLYNSLSFNTLTGLILLRVLLSISVIVLIAIKFLAGLSNKNISFQVIVFVLITASEVANRYIFFLSFEKSGL